jgi:hypothetical protein
MVARSSAGRVLSIQSHTVHVKLQQLPCLGFYSVFVFVFGLGVFFDESELELITTSLLLQSSVGFCIVDKRIAFCTLVVSRKISHGRVCCHMSNSKTVLRCLACYLSYGGVFRLVFLAIHLLLITFTSCNLCCIGRPTSPYLVIIIESSLGHPQLC